MSKMAPGRYFVGDPCYVLSHRWDEICTIIIAGQICLEGAFNVPDGQRFSTFGTRWGDGVFNDQNGKRYSVDAGMIGAVPESMFDPELDFEHAADLGQFIDFDTPFRCGTDGSKITIGHIIVDTDPPYDDEEEEE